MNDRNTSAYQICTRCVMDTSDPGIVFDGSGICNHCYNFEKLVETEWFPNQKGNILLEQITRRIKLQGEGNEYDCILGLSGGVDSSYLALKVKELGLRPLVMHVDAGWNSELATYNIQALVNHCGFDLHSHVVDWDEMRDLQIAYLRSGVANQDVPQDHAFFASMYHFAVKHKIKFILSGGNTATEGIYPGSWEGNAMDVRSLRDIHKKFGERKLKRYKTISFFHHYFWYPFFKNMRTVRPLNYIEYNKDRALNELVETVNFKPYPRKHGESTFTKIFQNYILPRRFGYDKRRPHFSSLIASGQINREQALKKLEEPLYSELELDNDIAFFCKKMRITRREFEDFMNLPLRYHSDYKNYNDAYLKVKKIQRIVEEKLNYKIKPYS